MLTSANPSIRSAKADSFTASAQRSQADPSKEYGFVITALCLDDAEICNTGMGDVVAHSMELEGRYLQ